MSTCPLISPSGLETRLLAHLMPSMVTFKADDLYLFDITGGGVATVFDLTGSDSTTVDLEAGHVYRALEQVSTGFIMDGGGSGAGDYTQSGSGSFNFSMDVESAPEPSTTALLIVAMGIGGLLLRQRRGSRIAA